MSQVISTREQCLRTNDSCNTEYGKTDALLCEHSELGATDATLSIGELKKQLCSEKKK